MKTLIKYDFFYLKKTSRLLIIPAIVLFFAILSPVTAKYMNQLLDLLLEDSGLVIELTEPRVIDSYIQYIGNLYELILYVLIFMSVGMFIRDKTKGILPLVLSKPISKANYILSKYLVFNGIVIAILLVGSLVFSYYTYFLFDEVDLLLMINVTLLFSVYLLFITAVGMFNSILTKSYPIAILLTFVFYIVSQILSIADVGIFKYLPGHVITRIGNLVADNFSVSNILYTVITTIVLSVILLFASIEIFKRKTI